MKWKNKGSEFDQYVKEKLLPFFKEKYYIFGAGILGKELVSVFNFYNCMGDFIDNDEYKQGRNIKGFDVISLEEYLKKKDGQIVIAVSDRNISDIKLQLESNSLIHNKDFFLRSEFIHHIFPIISTYFYRKSYVALAQIALTERCTLKCKKCAHGCFAVDNNPSNDLALHQVYRSADAFFSKVDFVKEFVLIGGEPLLYKNLAHTIQYIGDHYRNQMGLYVITTNGTIVPENEVLIACQKYKVLFRISNYTYQIPRLKNFYKRLTDTLEKHNISFVLGEADREWMDYGFGYVDRNAEKEKLIEVFDQCGTPCREVRENRFYFCVMARSVSDNLGYHIGEMDYLDLDKLTNDYKKEFLEFTLGYSDKGYLDMCNYCNGVDAKQYLIPAAEQVNN